MSERIETKELVKLLDQIPNGEEWEYKTIEAVKTRLEELEKDRERHMDALRFYADKRKYAGPNSIAEQDEECVAGFYRLDVTRDGGEKARAAMEAKQ